MSRSKTLQKNLLAWYDRHRRVMPWRARAGRHPDPYHVWMSEIMLQQTTVATVGAYFVKFTGLWPTVQELAAADLDDVLAAWAGLGYYARARNLHKCAQAIVRDHSGRFPADIDALLALPGIGPYTAAAIASIAFDIPAVAVDGNVERVVSRFFAITDPLPQSKKEIHARATEVAEGCDRPGDFTQAFMELGATVCTPRNPKCGLCPWIRSCRGRQEGIAEGLPAKSPKKVKPVRHGKVFWITDGKGRFLIEKRKGKGLYEGMYQLPTTPWLDDASAIAKMPSPKGFRVSRHGETVRHSLTHFDLILEIWCGSAQDTAARDRVWISATNMSRYALPTLMKKAVRLCLDDKQSNKG
jgi:A/G-specific adenine glycosylase